MDAKLTEVCSDPLSTELFGHSGSRSAADEKISDDVAFVAAGLNDSLQQRFGLLGLVALCFTSLRIDR